MHQANWKYHYKEEGKISGIWPHLGSFNDFKKNIKTLAPKSKTDANEKMLETQNPSA